MKKILVADDSAFIRTRLTKFLTEQGYEVIQASNGQIAIDLYKKETPDAVFMDIVMPELNGMEALTEIIKFDAKANVIMLTASKQDQLVIEALQIGAVDFIGKPYQDEQLLFALANLS